MIILKRKKIIFSVLTIFIGILVGSGLQYIPKQNAFDAYTSDTIRVIVDAGHGYPDGGAVGVNGTVEKDINLQIARKVQEVLEGKGIEVVMTRIDDNGLQNNNDVTIREMKRSDMNKRLNIMKNSSADLFLSIHMNYFEDQKVNGLHIFYAKNNEQIEPLAENIQQCMNRVTGAKSHAIKVADKNLFLMKNPPIPAILVECGFLSNPDEEKKLCDEDYQSRISWAIADSVEKYYKDQL